MNLHKNGRVIGRYNPEQTDSIRFADNNGKEVQIWRNGVAVNTFAAAAIDSITFAVGLFSYYDYDLFDYGSGEEVTINGVRWATRNVDAPGTFAASLESAGMFYQWNRRTGWPATGGVSDWDMSTPFAIGWATANDPSPAGWRVPTLAELQTLLDADKVSSVWTARNGVKGRRFTDKATGAAIFLPVTGHRSDFDGTLYGVDGDGAVYWSATPADSNIYAYILGINVEGAFTGSTTRLYGFSIRCVAE
jgi:uncharacterized protein (TIGR02145 family)